MTFLKVKDEHETKWLNLRELQFITLLKRPNEGKKVFHLYLETDQFTLKKLNIKNMSEEQLNRLAEILMLYSIYAKHYEPLKIHEDLNELMMRVKRRDENARRIQELAEKAKQN